MGQSSIVDNTGYWGNTWEKNTWASVCVKDAVNQLTPNSRECIALHKWDDSTGRCEWTGPKDACLQTNDVNSNIGFMRLPYFPLQTWKEQHYLEGVFVNDQVSKVVVRRGCLYTGYPGFAEFYREAMPGNINIGYGEHKVPCYYTGSLGSPGDGLSYLKCLCDPTEATLNDHVPSPPPDKKCIEHHEFDEKTQQCEWIHDPKYCAELITFDGRKQMVEIPDWPKNKKYDVDRWANAQIKSENFHIQVTQAIVRQHCWLTMLTGWFLETNAEFPFNKRQLPTSGYGKHKVKSHYNGELAQPNDGAQRVICECLR